MRTFVSRIALIFTLCDGILAIPYSDWQPPAENVSR
jgi:hypothetical protein